MQPDSHMELEWGVSTLSRTDGQPYAGYRQERLKA